MATDHENWVEQGEIYALGALEGEELKALEAHLASGCAICNTRIRETRETLNQLHRSLETITPRAAVKAKVLARVMPQPPPAATESSSGGFGWRWWMVGAGSFAAAAIAFILIANLMDNRSELARLKSQLAALQSESAQKDQLIAFFSAREVRAIELTGLAAAPEAKAKLFWNPVTRRGLLITFGLPKPSADKAYELWGIAGSEPVPAGVFSVDERGQTQFPLPELAAGLNFDKFAVTLEPAGGVAKPSGPMVLLGSL
jgi:anti-sigma-K factor RskA